MRKLIAKLLKQTKGMEALQSVILAAVGVILAVLLNGLGKNGMEKTTSGATNVFKSAGS